MIRAIDVLMTLQCSVYGNHIPFLFEAIENPAPASAGSAGFKTGMMHPAELISIICSAHWMYCPAAANTDNM